jgi:hypothetical protein
MEPRFRPGGRHYRNIWRVNLFRYAAADGAGLGGPPGV